jgi:hypothetical protein
LLKSQLGYQQLQRVWPPQKPAKTQVLHNITNLNYTVSKKKKEWGWGEEGTDAKPGIVS